MAINKGLIWIFGGELWEQLKFLKEYMTIRVIEAVSKHYMELSIHFLFCDK